MTVSLLTVTILTIRGLSTCGINNAQGAEKNPAFHTPDTCIHVASN